MMEHAGSALPEERREAEIKSLNAHVAQTLEALRVRGRKVLVGLVVLPKHGDYKGRMCVIREVLLDDRYGYTALASPVRAQALPPDGSVPRRPLMERDFLSSRPDARSYLPLNSLVFTGAECTLRGGR